MRISAISVIAILLVSATAASAQDDQERAICNISVKTCQNLVDILQKRIRKLNAEIKRGNDRYSAEEMKKLEQKLRDAMEQLDRVEAGAAKK